MLSIDLYGSSFWWFTALAVIVMLPLKNAGMRKIAFAAFNIGFIMLHCRGGTPSVSMSRVILMLVAGVLSVWLSLQSISRWPRAKPLLLAVGGALLLGLFIFHKLPQPDLGWGNVKLNSFLTLVGFSYLFLRLIDLERAVAEKRHEPPSPLSIINYLIPFHMLAAGPIQAYDEFTAQPKSPAPLSVRESLKAFERIVLGLFKKYVLAGMLEAFFLTGFQAKVPYLLVEVQLMFVWLYLDFSAYSDVAVGIGRLMGVATPENFNRPYLARNIVDFWERWHISLSQFIRRNIFFPVQITLVRWTDGRRPLLVASVAFTVSFLLCGLWHQINLRFLAWGAFQAAGLIVCNVYRYRLTKQLGRKGLNEYMANRWIKLASTVLTFEFSVLAVFIQTYPFDLPTWIPGVSE
jgi:D-alanyl-lipoteichoic acid acyltransferase DltB (MBOAT superfamily)